MGLGAILTVLLIAVLATLLLSLVLLALEVRRRDMGRSEIDSAVSSSWVRLGLGETIGRVAQQAEQMQAGMHQAMGQVEQHAGQMNVGLQNAISRVARQAEQIQHSYTGLEQLLRLPTERAAFGELALETILADQLPRSCFGIRKRCCNGKIPDGHIRAADGLICIDSKFPLENYARMNACAEGDAERERFRRQFLRDAEIHLRKVATDYVQPDHGTADFALVFIPSESVYYALATEGFELLRQYVQQGVQVVSPLLLAHKLEILKMGARAVRLNEKTQEVLRALQALAGRFAEIEEHWRVFYTTHFRNLQGKAVDLDESYARLHREFQRIADADD